MLPATLQFLITMIACAINERMQRKLDYTQEEVRVLKDMLKAASHAVDRGVNERRAVSRNARRRNRARAARNFLAHEDLWT